MEDAENFVRSKRIVAPVQYETGEKYEKAIGPDPVDFINILSSDSEDDDNNDGNDRSDSSSTEDDDNIDGNGRRDPSSIGSEGFAAAAPIEADNVRDSSFFSLNLHANIAK